MQIYEALLCFYLSGVALVQLLLKDSTQIWYFQVSISLVVWLGSIVFIEDNEKIDKSEEIHTKTPIPNNNTIEKTQMKSDITTITTQDLLGKTQQQQQQQEEEEDADWVKVPPATTAASTSNNKNNPSETNASIHLATLGNGDQEELSEEQIAKCVKLRDEVLQKFRSDDVVQQEQLIWFATEETARRYLVARGWSYKKALKQLSDTIAYRAETKPWEKPLHLYEPQVKNPMGKIMRVIGLDIEKRPVVYTSFIQATERFNSDENIEYMGRLLEATYAKTIRGQFDKRITSDAKQLQWIWVVDFYGFGLRDQNPRSAVLTAHLMAHYPEMLHCAVLLDAPFLFNGAWNLISVVLDERVKSKVIFAGEKSLATKLEKKVGGEVVSWIQQEMKIARLAPKQEYWIPTPEHDGRGTKSYVESEFYIKTCGDEHEERKKKSN